MSDEREVRTLRPWRRCCEVSPPAAGADFSPPPARAARGGEGSGVGGASAYSTSAWAPAEPPPTPDPSPPLRGGRGEERRGSAERDSKRIANENSERMNSGPY